MIRTAIRVALAALPVSYGYQMFLGHRSDYLGHLLAGMGGTLLLLFFTGGRRPLLVVAAVSTAILIGTFTEATVFRLAVFDPVDWTNQSVGAVLAGVAVSGRKASRLVLLAAAAVLLVLGFVYAFR